MKKFIDVIQKSVLFAGTSESETEAMLKCLGARTAEYEKNEQILRVGESVDAIGMLLSGAAYIIQEDFWGNRNIIAKILPGQLFAEAFACTQGLVLNVSVIADSPTEVLFLNVRRILTVCPSSCEFHSRVVRNLLAELAGKNLRLNEKMTHMSKRTTREKLLSYLSAESRRQGTRTFDLPYNRQQLADYLSVDRSAMSGELGRLRDEGVLRFDRNHFELLLEVEDR